MGKEAFFWRGGEKSMKKRIAVLGNGWSVEYLKVVLKGIRQAAESYGADIFFFMNYSVNDDTYEHSVGEANIFNLSECSSFDGYILLSNTFHLAEEFEFVKKKFAGADIPVISLEYKIEGIPFLGSDNYSGMRNLCDHLIEKHDVRRILFISGPVDHEENQIRKNALEDALIDKGLQLKAEDVLICNWNVAEVELLMPKWLEKQKSLPGAVVAANDMMAMGACNVLENAGYVVPDDVIVTGFDHLSTAEAYSPSIATVDRNWENLGYRAVEYIFDKLNHNTCQNENYVPTKSMPNESCGCTRDEKESEKVAAERRYSYNNYLSRANIGLYVCALADSISKAVSEQQLCQVLKNAPWNATYEGKEFYICLVDNFFSSLLGGEPLREEGYSEIIDVIYGRKDGEESSRYSMECECIVPCYDTAEKDSKLYVMLPLYGEEGTYGYVVFGSEVNTMYDYSMYSWVRHMNMNLRHVRRGVVMNEMNNKLENLSNTDTLTGVYNRLGCDNIAYPFLEECHKQGRYAALMFADVNRMKNINDNFGHIQGDLALKTVAKAITEVLQEDWIVVRYGGDEFLMVGECRDSQEVCEKQEEIAKYLKNMTEELQLPYKLRVSLGHVIVNPNEKLNMSECLTRAEDAMYTMKKKLHAEE